MRVLIVEDEALVALDLAAQIEEIGHEVLGPVFNFEKGMAAIEEHDIDLALLDMNLRGVSSEPIARSLAARDIPFIFITGYGSRNNVEYVGERARLAKPISTHELKNAINP